MGRCWCVRPDRAATAAFLCPSHSPLVICLFPSSHHTSNTFSEMSALWQPSHPCSQFAGGAAGPPAGSGRTQHLHPLFRTVGVTLCRWKNVPVSNYSHFAAPCDKKFLLCCKLKKQIRGNK